MDSLSRRNFLKRGSVAVAGAGALVTVPITTLLPDVMGSGEAAVPAAETTAADLSGGGAVGDTLIAHVRNLGTGEISIMRGLQEVTIHDPQTAARIAGAIR
ncbi:MAG: twin-arginine translocation signal domain-containing protein [Acidimicrobiales bacterium]